MGDLEDRIAAVDRRLIATDDGRPGAARYRIDGRDVALPVRIGRAEAWMTAFQVPTDGVADLIGPVADGPFEVARGRSLCLIVVVRYLENELGRYDEIGVMFPVRTRAPRWRWPGVGPLVEALTGGVGTFVHELPVTAAFSCEAGQRLWGLPKWIGRIDLRVSRRSCHARLEQGGRHVLTLDFSIGRGLWPLPRQRQVAYARQDGELWRTPWSARPRRFAIRPGGARLELGDHPVADELARLGLPRRPVASARIGGMAATFEQAERAA